MKLFSIALLLTAVAVAAEPQVQLKQVQSVYILPMASGMDQYLANKITRQGLFVIVTDPQRADAILADRIGEPFERKLEELYPAPKKPEPKKPEPTNPEKETAGKDADKADTGDKDTIEKKTGPDVGPPIDHPSSFGRGKGTIFLVDRKSRAVIWSTYDRPNNMHADTLDKTADQIVSRIKHDLNAKETK